MPRPAFRFLSHHVLGVLGFLAAAATLGAAPTLEEQLRERAEQNRLLTERLKARQRISGVGEWPEY